MSFTGKQIVDSLMDALGREQPENVRERVADWLTAHFDTAAVAFMLDRTEQMNATIDIRADRMARGARDLTQRFTELVEWDCERDAGGEGIDRYEARVMMLKPSKLRPA